MNFFIRGASSVTYSAEASEVLERFSGLNSTERSAIALFVDTCVSDGNWTTLLKEIQIRVLGATNGLIGLKGVANATNNGGVFGAEGVTYNGTSSFISTGVNLSTIGITQNNALFGGFVSDKGTDSTTRCLWGGNVGTERTQIFTLPAANSNTYSTGVNSTATADTGIVAASGHLIGAGRGNATTNFFEVDGVIVDTNTVNSAALSNIILYEGARNNNGTAANFSDGTIAFFYIAQGIGFNRIGFHLAVNQLLSDLGLFFLDRFPYQIPHILV